MSKVFEAVVILVVAVSIALTLLFVSIGLAVILAVFWAVPVFITEQQGKAKNRPGLAWGFFLGWLGVLAMAALPANKTAATPQDG